MKSRTRFSKKKRGIECLNCGQPLSPRDNFCSNCGQVNDDLPISIKQFISDFFAGFLNFDSRFFKTFGPLLFKPGKVPKDYIEGKRMKYVNPFQLYLNVTIVFFLITGIFSAIDRYTVAEPDKIMASSENDTLKIEKPVISIINDTLQKRGMDHANTLKDLLIKRMDSVLEDRKLLDILKNDSIPKKEKDSVFLAFYNSNLEYVAGFLNVNKIKDWKEIEKISDFQQYSSDHMKKVLSNNNIAYEIPQKAAISVDDQFIKLLIGESVFKTMNVFMKYDEEHPDITPAQALKNLGFEINRWNMFYYKKSQDVNKFKKDEAFREAWVDSIVSKISIALFFLLPIFTFFIWLIYIRGSKNYTEHLVFVFSVQTVFFLLMIFFTVFNRVLKTDLGMVLFFPIFLFYLERAMKRFYGQHWIKTILKFFILNTVYVALAIIGLVIISFLAFVLQ